MAALLCRGGLSLADDEVNVPPAVQAGLMARVAAYQANLPGQADGIVRTLVLTRSADPQSSRVGQQLAHALGELKTIAGLPHTEAVEAFSDAESLARACRERRLSVVYVGPGLGDAVPAIAEALKGSEVLTVSAVTRFVPRGLVLGFDLVSGRPQLLVFLRQARAQRVRLEPAFLRIVKVYE